jgi:predicted Zn-dependent protease
MAAAGYDPQAAVRYLPSLPADDAANLKAVNAAIEKPPTRAHSANTRQR